MKGRYPKTIGFLKPFEEFLTNRPEYKRWGGTAPFYELYRIGPYTFTPYKIVWRGQVAVKFGVAVVSQYDGKIVIPDQTVYLIPFENPEEAHYCAALLNSSPVRCYYKNVAYKHASMDFVGRIAIPKFMKGLGRHKTLAELSNKAHQFKIAGKEKELQEVEQRIDESAAEIWGLAAAELTQIQRAIKKY